MSRLKQLVLDLMQQEQPQQPQGSWGDLTTYPYGENSRSTSNLAEILAGTEVERGMFAPLVEYGDGRIEYGVPNALMAPARAVHNMLTPGYDYGNTQQAARDSFDAAGLIATGGLAGAGVRPRGSIGMGGGGLMPKSIGDIESIIKSGDFDRYGLRVTDEPLTVGVKPPNSRVWIDGNPTDDLLDGASMVIVEKGDIQRALKGIDPYPGKHISLIGSNYGQWGEDVGEWVAKDGKVLSSWSR